MEQNETTVSPPPHVGGYGAAPVIPGVTFLNWSAAESRAHGAIVREKVSAEVMAGIYRRLIPSARLDMAETKRRKVFAFLCAAGMAGQLAPGGDTSPRPSPQSGEGEENEETPHPGPLPMLRTRRGRRTES